MDSTDHERGATYEIRIQGELDAGWQGWFDGLAMTVSNASAQRPVTTLAGPVADQAALRGLLCKLWDLNLTLISVRRTAVDGEEEEHD